MQFQLPKINYDDSDTFLFIYLLRKSHFGDKNSETTEARNLKLGTDDRSKHEVAHSQLCWRYVTCFGAHAPKTCSSEVY